MSKEYDLQQIVSGNLRILRTRKGISQLELSVRTGLTLAFVNKIENGKKWVSANTLSLLCRELDAFPFEFFLSGDIPDHDTGYRSKKTHEQMITELDEVISRYKKESAS
jgi:transcriptional regulator with XRE-family HTH domain